MTISSRQTVVKPARSISGSIRLPGDKSISHRYAMLGGLAGGTTTLRNYSTAADCASTLGCMQALGCSVRHSAEKIEIDGSNGNLLAPATRLDCGNSGSTMRMLAGILAGQSFTSEMFGDESLSARPMRRVIDPLQQMGASIQAAEGYRPPLKIRGTKLHAIDYKTPVASAQVKSCVLLAGLFADGTTSVEEPLPTRDHTELALKAFGVEVVRGKNKASVAGGQKLKALEAYIPGDLSSSTFFLCAAALFPGANLVFDQVLLNPTRSVILDVMATMGLKTNFLHVEEQNGELVGTLQVQSDRELSGAVIQGATSAALIDELPALAAIAPFTKEGIVIRDARELRVKESDRIAGVTANLRRMGAQVEEFEDGMRIPGAQKLHGAEIDSLGDHRIAMAFSVAALRAQGETVISGSDAVAVSFPTFYDVLDSVAER